MGAPHTCMYHLICVCGRVSVSQYRPASRSQSVPICLSLSVFNYPSPPISICLPLASCGRTCCPTDIKEWVDKRSKGRNGVRSYHFGVLLVTLVCYNVGGGCRSISRASTYTNASSSSDNEVWPNSASSNTKERDISEHHKR